MDLKTLLQHRFKVLWKALRPMRRTVFTPASLDSCNMAKGAGRLSKERKLGDSGWLLQGDPWAGVAITFAKALSRGLEKDPFAKAARPWKCMAEKLGDLHRRTTIGVEVLCFC